MQISWLGAAAYLAYADPGALDGALDAVSPRPISFSGWSTQTKAIFLGAVFLGIKVLSWLVLQGVGMALQGRAPIEVRGKHLDSLSTKDYACIYFNRATVPFVTFHIIQYVWTHPKVQWGAAEMGLGNTIGAVAACFMVYDFVYYFFHL